MKGRRKGEDIHLRVKKARCSLHHRNRLIIRLNLVNLSLLVRQHRNEIQLQLRRIQIRNKVIRKTGSLTSRNLDIISSTCQVTNDASPRRCVGRKGLGRDEGATDECNLDGFGLVVGEVQ